MIHMDFSKLLHGFVKIDTCGSKLLHGFFNIDIWICYLYLSKLSYDVVSDSVHNAVPTC